MDISLKDVVLDLVPILEEAGDSGRLVGSESTRIEEVSTDAYVGRSSCIRVRLDNGEEFELNVSLVNV